MNFTRRKLLQMGLGTTAAIATVYGCSTQTTVEPVQAQSSATAQGPSLRQRAAAKGLLYGAAANHFQLRPDSRYQQAVAEECDVLIAENELKWEPLSPARGQYNFEPADWMFDFARSHNQRFRGHTLVWQQALPGWFESTATSQNAEQILIEHITKVAGHYAGRIHSWDVVNEGMNAQESNRPDGLNQNSAWLRLLGKDYVDIAFRAARAADRQALLVYNEGWLDYDTERDGKQRRNMLNFLEYLQGKGTPVDALGIQAHLFAGERRFNPRVFRAFLQDVASMGLKIFITELDVVDESLPADIAPRDRRVAEVYEEYLTTALDEPAVKGVFTWGLSDRYTWLTQYGPRSDGRPVRVLPLDDQFQRKPAWQAIARAFDQAPRRTPA